MRISELKRYTIRRFNQRFPTRHGYRVFSGSWNCDCVFGLGVSYKDRRYAVQIFQASTNLYDHKIPPSMVRQFKRAFDRDLDAVVDKIRGLVKR